MINQQSYWLLLACLCAVAAVGFASDDVSSTLSSNIEEIPATEAPLAPAEDVEEPSTESSQPEDVVATEQDEPVTSTNEDTSDDLGARLMNAVSQLDEQVRADIEPLALETYRHPDADIKHDELVDAILGFYERESSKPEDQRRYGNKDIAEDIIRVLADDCKLVNDALGDLISQPAYDLNEDELDWYVNGKICKQMVNRMPATVREVETKIANLSNQETDQ